MFLFNHSFYVKARAAQKCAIRRLRGLRRSSRLKRFSTDASTISFGYRA